MCLHRIEPPGFAPVFQAFPDWHAPAMRPTGGTQGDLTFLWANRVEVNVLNKTLSQPRPLNGNCWAREKWLEVVSGLVRRGFDRDPHRPSHLQSLLTKSFRELFKYRPCLRSHVKLYFPISEHWSLQRSAVGQKTFKIQTKLCWLS